MSKKHMKRKTKPAPEIPDTLEEVANEYNLTIGWRSVYQSFIVTDVSAPASLLMYRSYEFTDLTAEQLELDIIEAIENYEPRQTDFSLHPRHRSPVTGRYLKVQ